MAGDAPQLAVRVIRGRDLTLVDGRPCDPCVCVAVEKQRYTTQVRTGAAAAPEWNESFLFSVPAGTKDLVLTVSDWSGGERERALGTATIQLSDRLLTLNRPHHAWVPLQAASADTSSLNSDGSIAAASSERDGARGAVMIEVSVYSPYYLHVSCACPWCARGFIYRFNRFSVGNQIEYKGPASATPANARHANGETASAPAHVDAMADNVLAPPASAQRADGETASSHHHEPVDAMADNAPAPPASERHEDGETASSPHHEPVDATADTTPAPPDSERHEDGETASLPHHEPVDAMADNTPAPPASARHADGETASADAEGAADAADGGLRAEGVADSESPEDADSGDEDVVTEEELEVLRKEAEEARQELERVREESAAEAAAEEAAAVEAAALVTALETIEPRFAIRVIPEERSVMLLQVSKTMRTAMEHVRPPAMIKVKKGQTILTESIQNAMLDMMKWCSITTINLSNATIRAEGVGGLASVLGRCASLAHLDLCANRIGDEGAGMLAAVLGQCASLAHLDLRVNEIGDEGAGRLAAVLGQCASLDHLNLRPSKIGAEGAGRLAAVAANFPSLTLFF